MRNKVLLGKLERIVSEFIFMAIAQIMNKTVKSCFLLK